MISSFAFSWVLRRSFSDFRATISAFNWRFSSSDLECYTRRKRERDCNNMITSLALSLFLSFTTYISRSCQWRWRSLSIRSSWVFFWTSRRIRGLFAEMARSTSSSSSSSLDNSSLYNIVHYNEWYIIIIIWLLRRMWSHKPIIRSYKLIIRSHNLIIRSHKLIIRSHKLIIRTHQNYLNTIVPKI